MSKNKRTDDSVPSFKGMEGFEEAFGPLRGFAFADEQSLRNALWALHWGARLRELCAALPTPRDRTAFRPPMVVIRANAPGLGKSTLASRITNGAPVTTPFSWSSLSRLLDSIAFCGAPFLVLDDVDERLLSSPEMCRFITSSARQWRQLGTSDMIAHPLTTMVVATINGSSALPLDVVRRSIVINLKSRAA